MVVNGGSIHSRTLANHYCSLRNIPMRNVIVLRAIPNRDRVTIDEFRELILNPVLQEIEARGLTPTIQGVAYSSDMPTSVTLDSDLKELKDRSKFLTPVGSINGLTFLYRWVLAKNPAYIGFESNWYAGREGSTLLNVIAGNTEEREELQRWIQNNDHEKAAERFDQLRGSVDNSYPLDFLAARQWALAGNREKALDRLTNAIRKGWRYRKEITGDPAFDALQEDAAFKKLVGRCPNDDFRYLPTRGFNARTFYGPNTVESLKPDQGVSYMLSTVLSVTRFQGLTPPEGIAHLERSVAADYSMPSGTFFFTKTGDVRTKAREPMFALAVEKLKSIKHDAKIIEQPLPSYGQKCAGVMFGLADFQWDKTGATLLPGSIAESLTSYGGAMTTESQTKATELLRFGAAASSGAVTEPYSIPNKFPHPMIHFQYAQGLTCAEAFYASVLCPYQLLIVGDPLCQPFTQPPRFALRGIEKGAHVSETVGLQLVASEDENTVDPTRLTWMVDGVPRNETPFQSSINVQVAPTDLGAQEWRLIARGPKPIEPRYEQSVWVSSGDPDKQLELRGPERWKVDSEKKLRLELRNVPKDSLIAIRHEWEVLPKQPAVRNTFEIPHAWLGSGPVRLQGVVVDAEGKVLQASMPITVMIEE